MPLSFSFFLLLLLLSRTNIAGKDGEKAAPATVGDEMMGWKDSTATSFDSF